MKPSERNRLNEAARAKALEEFMTPERQWILEENGNTKTSLVSEMAKKFGELPRKKQLGVFFGHGGAYADPLKILLAMPTNYCWNEHSAEYAVDPISGNRKPKTRQQSAVIDSADKVAEARREFMGYLCRQTAAAQAMESPTAAEYRKIYIELRRVFDRGRYLTQVDAAYADKAVDKLAELEFELMIDAEISNAIKEVAHA